MRRAEFLIELAHVTDTGGDVAEFLARVGPGRCRRCIPPRSARPKWPPCAPAWVMEARREPPGSNDGHRDASRDRDGSPAGS